MSAPLNFQTLFELDVNPEGVASYKRLGDGITSASAANNEKVDQKSYLDDDGAQSSNVVGFQRVYSFSGDYVPGDDVQDYILGLQFAMGDARKTNFRVTYADGSVVSGPCVIANIQAPGGDAAAVSSFGFEIHMNGKPNYVPPAAAAALTATIAAGAASGTTKATATAGVGNRLAYRLTAAALAPNGGAYLATFTEYTSGADIVATAGQYLNVFELDSANHVVKFSTKALVAGDIKA